MPGASDSGFRALERGLRVIKFFANRERPATIADVARGTGLDRAVVRRILLSLKSLGYVQHDEGRYSLLPSVLELGYAYLSSDPLPAIADARLEPLAEQLQESCSLGVLGNGRRVTYLSTVQFKRVVGPTLTVGTSADPHLTSIGRTLLAHLDDDECWEVLGELNFDQVTPRTMTDRDEFMATLAEVRDQGWCLVDQELELGLIALAVPVRGPQGDVIAAANVASHTSRITSADLLTTAGPPLRDAVDRIEADLRHVRR